MRPQPRWLVEYKATKLPVCSRSSPRTWHPAWVLMALQLNAVKHATLSGINNPH